MQLTALIHAIVRQTTVLIAQLATTAGLRAPLAHLANQVFLDVVRELEAQGLGRKVVADMFGIALRTYQRKVQRVAASLTDHDRTLWEATFDFIRDEGPVDRVRILTRFTHDDGDVVRAVLHDLTESGLVYRTGRGNTARYRAADPDEVGRAEAADEAEARVAFVWLHVYHEGPVTLPTLRAQVRLPAEQVVEALDELEATGRVERLVEDGVDRWRCTSFLLPVDTRVGWEAAFLHHYQAIVTAMVNKLRVGTPDQVPQGATGGSTYDYLIWPGHPHEAAVYGLLSEVRQRATALRTSVSAHNDAVGRPTDANQVTFYVGQGVILGRDKDPG